MKYFTHAIRYRTKKVVREINNFPDSFVNNNFVSE